MKFRQLIIPGLVAAALSAPVVATAGDTTPTLSGANIAKVSVVKSGFDSSRLAQQQQQQQQV